MSIGSESEPMKKPASVKQLKENPSTERLVQPTTKSSRWNRLKKIRCPKCFRKTETRPVPISTITKGGGCDPPDTPQGQRCFGKYLCCFCHKCKLRKRADAMTNGKRSKCKPDLRCVKFKSGFKNLFTKASSRGSGKGTRNSAESEPESGVACLSTAPTTREEGCCATCKNRVVKCLGILCCLNMAWCLKIRGKCGSWCSCCKKCRCWCCGARKKSVITEAERRRSTMSYVPPKRKWTRVLTDFPKLDSSFVEHGSVMRGSIPVLPVPLAWICLILNVFLPGFGTLSSGIFCLCVGKPRFSINDSILSRIGAFLVNLLVAGSQLFTVLFCLVGWGWSIWWGVIMLKMAKKNKRIILAEQGPTVSHIAPVVDQNHDPEKGTSAA